MADSDTPQQATGDEREFKKDFSYLVNAIAASISAADAVNISAETDQGPTNWI